MHRKLLTFIDKSPVCYFAVKNLRQRLEDEGFTELRFGQWTLAPGGKYFLTRGGGSILAFRMPEKTPTGFVIATAHSDSPCFRIHDKAEMVGDYVRLDVEKYGGVNNGTWMDRPLSVAGRVMVRTKDGLEARLIDMEKDVALMPSPPAQLYKVNAGAPLDPIKDLIAIYGLGDAKGRFYADVAKLAGCKEEDVVSTDLYLYSNMPGKVWGANDEFISAPRFDDLACAFCCMEGLIAAKTSEDRVQVAAVFDHEEIGSRTKQAAGSNFLPNLLRSVSAAVGLTEADHLHLLDNSWMISADNAHARHPNHTELNDFTESPVVNGGPVVKHAVKYSTDGPSSALFKEVCHRAGVPVQDYSNRPNIPGATTQGNISTEETSIYTLDIGLAQLAMHSAYETQGSKDVEYTVQAIKASYESRIDFDGTSFRFL